MDLTDYAGLQLAILDYLNRDDLTAQVPGFIALAESQITRRVRAKTIRETVSLDADHIELPEELAELRSLHLKTGTFGHDGPMAILTPHGLAARRTRFSSTGIPRYAAIIGDELHVVPTPEDPIDLEITYYEKLVPLSEEADTNSTLLESPDVYLFGALKEAAPFLEHDERAVIWGAKFESAVEELNLQRQRQEYGASIRPQQLPVVF